MAAAVADAAAVVAGGSGLLSWAAADGWGACSLVSRVIVGSCEPPALAAGTSGAVTVAEGDTVVLSGLLPQAARKKARKIRRQTVRVAM
jgi:hypothetical protein